MAGKRIEWPDDEKLLQIVLAAPSDRVAAQQLGVKLPSLQSHIDTLGLRPRVQAGRLAQRQGGGTIVDHTQPPSEAELLRQELRDARQALNQHRSGEVLAERILQALGRGLERVTPPPYVTLPAGRPAKADAHHRHLLLLSDFHGGERVDSGAVHGLNVYDWEVMERRVDEVLEACLSHKRRAPALTGLDLGFLGDMNSGFIHKELAETNEYGPIDGAIRIGYLLARIIERLAPHYPDLRVFGVVGNHGRLDKAPAAKHAHNNLDWVSYKLCEALVTRHKTVTCQFPEAGSLLWRIAGRTIYVWHGDGVRSTMPGVPWGGVTRRCNEYASTYSRAGIRIDHFALGHFHQTNLIQLGRILGNGALKGTDEWVQKSFGGGEAPAQLLVEFDEQAERMTVARFLTPRHGVMGQALELAEAA